MLDAGVRALHCAPLRSSLGDVLGVNVLPETDSSA